MAVKDFREGLHDNLLCFTVANDVWLLTIRLAATAQMRLEAHHGVPGIEAQTIWKFIQRDADVYRKVIEEVQALPTCQLQLAEKKKQWPLPLRLCVCDHWSIASCECC